MNFRKKEKIVYLSFNIDKDIELDNLNNIAKEFSGELDYEWEYSDTKKYIIVFFEKKKEVEIFINNFNNSYNYNDYNLSKKCPF